MFALLHTLHGACSVQVPLEDDITSGFEDEFHVVRIRGARVVRVERALGVVL